MKALTKYQSLSPHPDSRILWSKITENCNEFFLFDNKYYPNYIIDKCPHDRGAAHAMRTTKKVHHFPKRKKAILLHVLEPHWASRMFYSCYRVPCISSHFPLIFKPPAIDQTLIFLREERRRRGRNHHAPSISLKPENTEGKGIER